MRICLISPNFPPMSWPCGAADFVDQLSHRLTKVGHEVAVLTSNQKAALHDMGRRELRIVPGNWGFSHVRRIRDALASSSFDIVDVQYEAAMYGGRGAVLTLPLWARRRPPQFVLTLHSEDLPQWGGRLWRPVQLQLYSRTVFYSSRFMENMTRRFPTHAREFHLMGFPSNIMRRTNPAIASLAGKIKTGWSTTPFLIVYFGHISSHRGIEDVLASLRTLRAKELSPQLAFLGQFTPEENPYHRSLMASLRKDGLDSQVSFTGTLTAEQVSDWLQAADLCVLPFPRGASLKNGSLAAAIEHGTPTVTTVGDLTDPEVVRSGALQTYPAGDSQRLAGILEQLLRSPERCRQLRERTYALADLLSWDAYLQARSRLYAALTGSSHVSSPIVEQDVENPSQLGRG